MKYKWQIKEDFNLTEDFLEACHGSEIVAKLLLNRKICTAEKAKSYLDPDFYIESSPCEISDLLKARDRILQAIDKGEKITIFGDYDVDGVTATSCLLITLREFTNNLDFYIPNRLSEGYGLNIEAVKTIAKKNKAKLLITCDCGITNYKEVELANELGMDVIVTDHHALPEQLPQAHAVLNPKFLPQEHKLHFLPGVGVAYKLAQAILEVRDSSLDPSSLLDLVTLGMIADLAPLVDENRYLVQIGLKKLTQTNKVGLQELLKMCGIPLTSPKINAEHIGFGIAPRINAVGRLTDASLAVRLLTTSDLLEAINISGELDIQNKERQLICEETLKEAVEMVEVGSDKCIVLAKEGWHHGVVGIVASRVVEKYSLPTILIAIDEKQNIARGSGRSTSQLDIVSALFENSRYLEKFGGHKAACGLSVKPENLNNFIFDFKSYVNNLLCEVNMEPSLNIDLELSLSDLTIELLQDIYKLSPFGLGNPMPVFASEGVEIVGIKAIGKNSQHLKLMIKAYGKVFEALIWNHDKKTQFNLGDKVKLAYTAKINSFNGETFIQLELKDWDIVESKEQKLEVKSKRLDEELELYDFRHNPQECLNLFSSQLNPPAGGEARQGRQSSILFFAESTQKDYLPLKTYSRTKISKTENLVFLEIPPDEFIFLDVVKRSDAQAIYLAFNSQSSILNSQFSILNPQSYLKRLIGMLKYAVNQKNCKVYESDLQAALGINRASLAYALELLVKIGALSFERNDNELNIRLNNGLTSDFSDLLEYNLFLSELKQILEFRNWMYNSNLVHITTMLSEHNIKTKSVELNIVRK